MNKPAIKVSSNIAEAKNSTAFWDNLTKLVKPLEKLSSSQAQQDPTAAMRARFINKVAEQIKLIQSAAPKSRWFTKLPDGSYELTVRNANMALRLGNSSYFHAKDAACAVSFLEAVTSGAKAGELDAQLKETTRKPPAKKAAAPAAAPAASK